MFGARPQFAPQYPKSCMIALCYSVRAWPNQRVEKPLEKARQRLTAARVKNNIRAKKERKRKRNKFRFLRFHVFLQRDAPNKAPVPSVRLVLFRTRALSKNFYVRYEGTYVAYLTNEPTSLRPSRYCPPFWVWSLARISLASHSFKPWRTVYAGFLRQKFECCAVIRF